MYLYPQTLAEKLEYDALLALLAGHCVSQWAREQARTLRPEWLPARVEEQLKATAEAYQLQAFEEGMPEAAIPHISAYLRTAFIEGAFLDEEQCFDLLKLLTYTKRLIGFFEARKELYPVLAGYTAEVELPKEAILALDQIIGADGRMRPTASKELSDLSHALNRL